MVINSRECGAQERVNSSADFPWLEHYESAVPSTIEVPVVPVHQLLTDAASKAPDRTALRLLLKYLPLGLAIQSRVTYRQLDEASGRFAAALADLGVQKGDRVAVMLPNIPQYVVAYFGSLKAGAVVVNTNPTYTARELRHQLEDSGAKCIVLMSGLVERLQEIHDATDIEHCIVADVHDSLAWPFRTLVGRQLSERGLVANVVANAPTRPDVHRFNDLLAGYAPRPTPVATEPSDLALFQYTGGTTGTPRAAMLTHSNLVTNAHQMVTWFTPLQEGKEKFLAALPFFHVYGMTVGILAATLASSEIVMVPDPRDLDLVLSIIEKEKITIFPGVPAIYGAIINHPRVAEYDFASIKACLSAGAALPVKVAEKFEQTTGSRLVEGYGLTEASPLVCGNPIMGHRKIGSIGVPIPNTRLSIVSLESDESGRYEELGIGERGEIVVCGPQVMSGYWNSDEETRQAIDSTGALHTGDIGTMDADGYFFVVDRKKDLIIASGYNIVPREVEEVLYGHPKVLEVAVAGVPDAKRGETVKAYIVLRDGMTSTRDEIRAFCKENLAPYKVPTLIEFRSSLPKSQVGKVMRRVLVEEDIAKMKAAESEEA